MSGTEHGDASDGTDVRVVIVDDQLPFRRVAAAVVARTPGFRVVGQGASGEQAVDLCRTLRPDLILLDVQMPGIGGIDAARSIIAAATATVILCSTHPRADVDLDPAMLFLAKEDLTSANLQRTWDATRLG
jgi:two-component system, NarL family, invasion response regulator UvrY